MCFRYGINGNDLDWDYLTSAATETCPTCDEEIAQWMKEHPQHTDMQLQRFVDNMECDGHTKFWTAKGWSVGVNSNSNNVYRYGKVPFAVYDMQYLQDWYEALEGDRKQSSKRSRILKELRQRPNFQEPGPARLTAMFAVGGM